MKIEISEIANLPSRFGSFKIQSFSSCVVGAWRNKVIFSLAKLLSQKFKVKAASGKQILLVTYACPQLQPQGWVMNPFPLTVIGSDMRTVTSTSTTKETSIETVDVTKSAISLISQPYMKAGQIVTVKVKILNQTLRLDYIQMKKQLLLNLQTRDIMMLYYR